MTPTGTPSIIASARPRKHPLRTWLASGVAAAALQAMAPAEALAGCTLTSDLVPVSSTCSSTFVQVLSSTGATALTVSDMITVGVELTPANAGTTPTSHNLIVTGNTTIFNPSYSAVYSETFAPNHDLVVSLGAGVTIGSVGGFGAVWLRNDVSGNITLDSAATVTATGGPGITATTNLGSVVVTNSGRVTSTDDRGVYADGGFNNTMASPALVSVVNTGTVSAYLAGIRTINYHGLSTITNGGTVTATTRQGLVAWSANGDASITNTGTVTAYDDNAVHAMSETGKVTVLNSGRLTAYDNAAVADSGVGHAGIWAEVGVAGNIAITNAATGVITAPSDFGIVALTPSGDVTVTNAGTIAARGGISAASTAGNVTVVNSGTITATATTNPVAVALSAASGTATLTNTGTINGGFTTAGGTNLIVNQGTWNLLTAGVTSAVYTASGTTTFSNSGTVAVASGGVVTISGLTRFTNEATGNLSLGAGSSLVLTGAVFQNLGRIDIAAGASLTSATVQVGGTMSVNGALGGAVVVDNGGLLQGSGSVGEATVTAGGTIAPGNSIGTLTVAGNYTQAAGSTYAVEVGPNGTSDRIHATGTATILGGTLAVTANGTPTVATRYTILTADGGVTGTYASLAGAGTMSAFVTAIAAYDANNVYLDLTQTRAFTAAALTANQYSAAAGIGSSPTGSALYSALAFLPTDQAARAAIDQISGEVHASIQGALVETSSLLRDAALDRVRTAVGAAGAAQTPGGEHFILWSRGFGAWGTAKGDGNARSLDRSTGGVLIGGDGTVLGDWRVGMLAGYSRTTVSGAAGSGASDNYHVGAFGGRQWGALGFRGGAAYTKHDVATSRAVGFNGFFDAPTAGYDAGTAQGFAEIGYGLAAGRTALEPFANLAHVDLRTDSFREVGRGAALTGAAQDTAVTFATLGLHAGTDVTLGAATGRAYGTVGWRHAFGDTTPFATLALAGGAPFSIAGAPIAADALVTDIGLDVAVATSTTLGVSYRGQFGADITDQGVRGTLAVRF
ncbi:MAG: autotransporter outer membrane beta-barrel domain-containing protein [Rhodoplanes sp.]|uniref:autotransporter outer membrane beta-barrel domain-containing protein n=1 Tax=Rhodoplanes sp. TaxID=1968906 RepID=UPI0017D58749|nr:autotransporter domain-containing protein [Rhodoplanes sp.]NVO16435.1 autotransporter outer membrane beta-barrel domain-containing protein [Rhodoplanes sp.]